jgi:Na+/alanine symporter
MSASANLASVSDCRIQGRLLLPILVGGAVAGTFDITSAFITYGWSVCRGIAAGLLGPGARHGGIGTWLLGLFLHFFIATTIAAVYCLSSRRLTFLREHFFLCGLFYGMAAWLVMNLIVLPLSAIHARGSYQLHDMIQGILVHMFLIALPIAFLNMKLSQSAGPLLGQ